MLARALFCWWIIVILFGAVGNAYLALLVFQMGKGFYTIVPAALSLGCCVLCYRTFKDRDQIRGIFKD